MTYTIADSHGATASSTLTLAVASANHNPVANNDTVSATAGAAITFDPRANDADQDGDALTIVSVSAAGHGSTVNNGASVTYTPTAGYAGSDGFTYTISDGQGGTASASVSVPVAPRPNQAPTANPDYVLVESSDPVTVDVVANDTDPDGDSLQVTDVSGADGGAYIVNGTTIGYNPPPVGPVRPQSINFTYTISDGHGGTATGAVRFQLNPY